MTVVDRILTVMGDRQAARWDRLGGPGPAWQWCLRHPAVVTIGVAVVVGGALATAFGAPPFSPLVLALLLVAPIWPVLRAQQRIHERWLAASRPEDGTT